MRNKKTISIIAIITLFAIIGTTVLFQFGNVYAQRRLPGLDSLISEKTSDTDTFRILEIVENSVDYVTENKNYTGPEIGFYIGGNEPFSLDENGYALDFETTILNMASQQDRKAYVEGLLKFLEGKYTTDENSTEYPLIYSEYADEYFLANPDDTWNRVDFGGYRNVQISGEYKLVEDETTVGDYSKLDEYVIAYDNEKEEYVGNLVEDIIGFSNVSDAKAYEVEFVPYGEAEYKDLGVYMQAFNNMAVVNTEDELNVFKTQQTEAGKPIFWVSNGEEGSYAQVDLTDCVFVDAMPETPEGNEFVKGTTLYYNPTYQYAAAKVEDVTLDIPLYGVQSYKYTFTGYEYTGQYGSILKDESNPYREALEGEVATHMKSPQNFIYTPGTGDYIFEEDKTGEKPLVDVEVSGFYYKGGFSNNGWFRDKVFLADEEDKILDLLPIEVRSLTVDQLFADYLLAQETLNNVDLLVINGSATMFHNKSADAANMIAVKLDDLITNHNLPCIFNSQLVESGNTSAIGTKLASYYAANTTGTAGAVSKSVYWYTGSLFNASFGTPYDKDALGDGFTEVIQYIETENEYLKLRGEEPIFATNIDRCISQSVVIQYILSKQYARNISDKSSLTILEIEPCRDYIFKLNASGNPTADCINKIRAMTGYQDKKVLPDSAIKVVQMTTAEFVGKIHDLNGVYDFIYIGMQTGLMNTDKSGNTVYNDANMNGLVYTSTGDYIFAEERLTGLLDTDYVNADRNNFPHARDVYGVRYHKEGETLLWDTYRTISDFYINRIDSDGDMINVDVNGKNLGYGSSVKPQTITLANQGLYRYSGNDITEENVDQLRQYVNAGYPIILDQRFAVDGNKSNGIDNKKVDNSSYLYEFLTTNPVVDTDTTGTQSGTTVPTTTVLEKDNVFLYTGSGDLSQSTNLQFYLNLPKLEVTFYEEAADGSYVEIPNMTNHFADDTQKFVELVDGQYYLKFAFSLKDDASASVLTTKYGASLFVDINSDGKFSRQEEKMQNLMIYTEDGTGVAADELVANKTYIARRRLPDAFRSIVTWKFEVNLSEKNDNSVNNTTVSTNRQSLIRQSMIGYSKLPITEETEVTKIKVLQILSDKKDSEDTTTWNLEKDAKSSKEQFYKDLQKMTTEQKISVEFVTMYINEYQSKIAGNRNYLFDQKYDMLILGFSDVYEGFTDTTAVDAIFDFIDAGKSVLMSHDTTSFVNYAGEYMDKKDKVSSLLGNSGLKALRIFSNSSKAIGGARWGYLLNQIVRDELGMDRYGITDSDYFVNGAEAHIERNADGSIKTKATLTMEEAKTELTILLKKGDILNLADPVKKYNANTICDSSITVAQLIEWSGKEVAYVAGSNRTQAYPETQGYTYMFMNSMKELLGTGFSSYVNTSSSVASNYYSGYWNLKTGSGIENFKQNTFGDWLKSILGAILDWLLGTDGILDNLKSVYNGAFNKMEISCVNQGQITEYPFKIPETFTINTTHPQYYQLDLATDKDNDGESDIVVWYCMSEGYNKDADKGNNPFSASPKDVRNNYYIYSIGNVFYTGAGHTEPDDITEKRLFLNTIVAAYNASVNDPSVTILESENIYAAEQNSINLPVEYGITDSSAVIGSDSIKLHYSVYDDNFVSNNVKELTVQYYVEDPNGTEEIDGVKVSPISRDAITTTQKDVVVGTVTKGSGNDTYVVDLVNSGNAYTATWTPGRDDLHNRIATKEKITVYVKVTSEFMHKGDLKSLTATDKLTIKKTNLFELD